MRVFPPRLCRLPLLTASRCSGNEGSMFKNCFEAWGRQALKGFKFKIVTAEEEARRMEALWQNPLNIDWSFVLGRPREENLDVLLDSMTAKVAAQKR